MRLSVKPDIKSVFIRDFNLCFFLSLVIYAVYQKLTDPLLSDESYSYLRHIFLPALNGFLTTLAIIPLNSFFRRREFTKRYYAKNSKGLMLVAFLAGFFSIYITISEVYTYLISSFIIFLAYKNILDFAGKITALLEPNKMATPEDVGEFANFFITLVITFAVINLSINAVHYDFALDPAFNFQEGGASIIDAIYFSIITMTTVGYGDIVPHNVIARAVVGIECLTSYFMLGIMIGIITRGISFSRNRKN